MTSDLDPAIAGVLAADLCSGCGACTFLDRGIEMHLDSNGFNRPLRVRPPDGATEHGVAERFRSVCPGVQLIHRPAPHAIYDPVIGHHLQVWQAWARDPSIRFQGSSGGALTALSSWLVSRGETVATAGKDNRTPQRTVPLTLRTREEVFAAAGSRYAPTSVLANPDLGDAAVVVAKPCEVAALSNMITDDPPLRLSFFCAGTPSQSATDLLITSLNPKDEPVQDMWYRGRGWPGRFTIVTPAGENSLTYEESWGKVLGPQVQWRCKVCPDGVGEFSDISAADYWESDGTGYPKFEEMDGRSLLIARTERGLSVIEEAIAAGVIAVEPVSASSAGSVQPLQRTRRLTLWGRMIGSRLAGRPVPRYRGFGLIRLAIKNPRRSLNAVRATRWRVRQSSRHVNRPQQS